MRESGVTFESDPGIAIAGTLCLPEDSTGASPVPALVLLGGTFGDTRDGDMDLARNPYASSAPKSGLLRRIAHALADVGVGSLRFDKRGCGESGGSAANVDAQSDLRDAIAAIHALRARPDIDPSRIGAAGHSAGASHACAIARDVPAIAAVGLLGMLYGSLEDLVRWNWGRVADHWPRLSEPQRDWLRANRKREVVGAFRGEEFIAAAARGDDRVRLEAEGVSLEFDLVGFRQGMQRFRTRSRLEQFREVRCPALILHGSDDMNVRVEDALDSYRTFRQAGNDRVDLVIVPGLDHNFQSVSADPALRAWERFTFASQGKSVSQVALKALSGWAVRVLRAKVPPL